MVVVFLSSVVLGAAAAESPKPTIPEPQPAPTEILIGAHHCPLWEADKPQMWNQVVKHPERTPALGFYSQENPEVADWETKWAVEHGVSYFVYCWYRDGQGGPVKMRFGSAIHDALFKSRFVSKMKFTIMWENQSRGRAGVADEADLMNNLLPFWIDNYFRHPSYLKIDNRPLLFIYRPEFLVQDLGSVENVRAAFDKMRQACRQAGFDGLYLLGEYRGLDRNHLQLMKNLGLDYTFAYCWHVQHNPDPARAIATQMDYIQRHAGHGRVAASGDGLARLERLAGRRQHLEDPAGRIQGTAAEGQGIRADHARRPTGQQDVAAGQLERVERRPLPRAAQGIRLRLSGRRAGGLFDGSERPHRSVAARSGLGRTTLPTAAMSRLGSGRNRRSEQTGAKEWRQRNEMIENSFAQHSLAP